MNTGMPVRNCPQCGVASNTVSMHSGSLACFSCWTYRKLDRPAAEHWHRVASAFLSNVDVHDMETYLPKALDGADRVTDYGTMLRSVQAVMLHSERVLKDGPYHLWEEHDAGQDEEAQVSREGGPDRP